MALVTWYRRLNGCEILAGALGESKKNASHILLTSYPKEQSEFKPWGMELSEEGKKRRLEKRRNWDNLPPVFFF